MPHLTGTADPAALGQSLLAYIGHPACGPQALRAGLDRSDFLPGGSDGEFLPSDPQRG